MLKRILALKDEALGAHRRRSALRELDARIRTLEARLAATAHDASERLALSTNLGNRWRDRFLHTGASTDLDTAIAAYRRALESATDEREACLVRANLAVALGDLFGATAALEHLDAAIDEGRRAIRGSAPGSLDRVRAMGNLAHALHERHLRNRQPADLDEAIGVAESALELAPRDTPERALCAVNLAVALLERRDAARAIGLLESARAAFPPASPLHARVLSTLHTARLLAGTRAADAAAVDDGDASIEALRQLLASLPPGTAARRAAQHALGKGLWSAYQAQGREDLLDEAIAALQGAATGPDEPGDLPLSLNDLGIALSERSFRSDSAQGLADAVAAWVRALLVLDRSFGTVPVAYKLGQQSVSISLGISERLVAGYLALGERMPADGRARMVRNAFAVAESSKARLMSELVGRGALPPPAGVPVAHAAREHELLAALRTIDTAELGAHGRVGAAGPGRTGRRAALLEELERLWQQMQASGPEGAQHVALRRARPVSWNGLQELANRLGPRTALASVFMTNARALLFVLRGGQDTPQVAEIAIDREGWLDLLQRFDDEIRRGTADGETWDAPLRRLLGAAADHVRGVERVVLAPQGWGLQLPWSVVARRAGWRGPDGRALPLVTIESLELLASLSARPRAPHRDALVVGNPTGDLAFAAAEATQVAARLGVAPLLGPAATKAQVLASLRRASIAHLATHAAFAADSPLDSGVALADGVLTAREILAESIRLDLLVLSACDTGRAAALGGYELAGLSQAFLLAGVRCLVTSLWAADEASTAAVMTAFYERWQAGADPATALRDAADAGGDEGERDAVYRWNAFVLAGDGTTAWPGR